MNNFKNIVVGLLVLTVASLNSFATLYTGTGTVMGSGTAMVSICKGDSVGITFHNDLHCFPNVFGIDVVNNKGIRHVSGSSGPLITFAPSVTEDLFGGDFGPLGYYALQYSPQQLVYIDTITGIRTTIGPSPSFGGHNWTGLAYDPSTDTWYASSTNVSASQLYTVDISTGAVTPVANIATSAGVNVAASIWIAIDNYGQMYTLDIVTDNLFRVDKYTGVATLVGPIGFNANYAQDADFDPTTNTLYLGAYNIGVFPNRGEFRWYDFTSGTSYSLGTYTPTNTEMDAMAIAGPGSTAGVIWSPTTGVSDPTSPHPYLYPTTTTTYYTTFSFPAYGTGTACTITDSITIVVNTPEATLDSLMDVNCYGDSTGEIYISTMGPAPISYAWNNGDATEDIHDLTIGSYYAFMTDAAGCTNYTDTFTLVENPQLIVTVDTIIDASCFGINDGSVMISHTGGVGPYTYSWNDGTATQDLTAVLAGDYAVTITDNLGCETYHGYYTINSPAEIVITYDSINNVLCNGDNNGGIFISVSGGTGGPYSYDWSDGSVTQDISTGLVADDYDVTVTDANGCEVTSVLITVEEPAALNTNSTTVAASCAGGLTNDGSINLTVTGGVAPFTYNWSNGVTTQDQTGLPAGNYTCTITDLNGCVVVTAVITINGTGTPPTVSLGPDTVSCGSMTLTATASAGVSYLWSTGASTPSISVSTSGSYWVQVSNVCGTDVDIQNIDIYGTPYASFGYWSYDRTVSFNNLSYYDATTTYLWDFGDGNTSTTFSPIHTYYQGGHYNTCLTVTNACGSETFCDEAYVFPLGIEEILGEGGSLLAYPNPASDQLMIDVKIPANASVTLRLIDVLGNEINSTLVQGSSYQARLDVSSLAAGVYGIEISNAKGSLTQRIVVVH